VREWGFSSLMISQKAKYAFKALFHLAEMPAGVSSSIEGIANAEAIPRKFLEHILLQLKRGRIVASHRGPHGGYRLVVPPAELTIGRILRLVDGPMAPLPCLSRTAYRRCPDCSDEHTCAVRHLFSEAYAAQLARFDTTTLGDALQVRPAALATDLVRDGIPESLHS
jgi:Rrf2 family protein